MDYSKLSDFEINQAIACNLNPDAYDFCRGEGESVWFKVSTYSENKDYCNNPADAWPIISENKISIYAAILGDSRGEWGAESSSTDYYHFHNNALRSAMIVFLMMQESANVPANPAGPDLR